MPTYNSALHHVVAVIEDEIVRIQDDLSDGSAKDFGTYQYNVGYVRALKWAINLTLDVEKKLDKS